jgi:hypothetical protein
VPIIKLTMEGGEELAVYEGFLCYKAVGEEGTAFVKDGVKLRVRETLAEIEELMKENG